MSTTATAPNSPNANRPSSPGPSAEGTGTGAPTRRERRTPPARSRLVVSVLAITGTVVALQQTLVVPVLPELPSLLDTTPDNASWLVTATLLTAAVATPTISRLADMFGKRRMMMLCLAVQLLGSVVAALGTSLALLIVGRALQGFAAALIPVGISIMRDVLPRDRVASATALMSATLGIGSAVGLPLSGFITGHVGWHSLFWVSGAMAAIMLVVVPLSVPESGVRTRGRFDALGALLLSAALICLLLAISKGNTWGWGSETTLLLLLAFVGLVAVWAPWQLNTKDPMVDLRTAAARPVLLTNIASVLVGFSMYGNMLSTTQLLQIPTDSGYGFGLDIMAAGLAMLPAGLVMVALSPVSATITKRFGGRTTLIVGSLVLAVGYLARVFLVTQLWQVIAGAALVSAGTAIAYAAMPTLIMSSVPITETAAANGFNALLRSVGTSTSSAAVAALLTSATMQLGALTIPTLAAFRSIFWVCAFAAVGGAVVAAFLPVAPRRTAEAAPAPTGPDESPDDIVVTGRVVGAGHGVRHAVVTLLTLEGSQVDWSRVEPDGTYSIVLPRTGRFLRVVHADGWAPRSEVVDLSAGQQPAVNLGDRLQLFGRVFVAGVPLPNGLVTLTKASGELVATTRTDAEGRYALPLPSHGRHVVTAVDPEAATATAENFTATGVPRELDVALPAA